MKSANSKIKTINMPVSQCYLSLIPVIRRGISGHSVNYPSKSRDFVLSFQKIVPLEVR